MIYCVRRFRFDEVEPRKTFREFASDAYREFLKVELVRAVNKLSNLGCEISLPRLESLFTARIISIFKTAWCASEASSRNVLRRSDFERFATDTECLIL